MRTVKKDMPQKFKLRDAVAQPTQQKMGSTEIRKILVNKLFKDLPSIISASCFENFRKQLLWSQLTAVGRIRYKIRKEFFKKLFRYPSRIFAEIFEILLLQISVNILKSCKWIRADSAKGLSENGEEFRFLVEMPFNIPSFQEIVCKKAGIFQRFSRKYAKSLLWTHIKKI